MNTINNIIMAVIIGLIALPAFALEEQRLPDIKDGVVSMKSVEPSRAVGYTVGDVLTRNITLTVKKPYILVKESLPIVGYQRRYKGQLVGIDLSDLTYKSKESAKQTTHEIGLSYQVFTNNVVAKPAALPPEFVRIMDTSKSKNNVYRYRIPSWNFSISPISVFGQVKVESDMSDFRGPLLMDASPLQQRLKFLLPILAISLLALLYMLGKHAWLPRMGGPFARAYKTIGKAEHNQAGLQQAMSSMHQALNNTAGYSLFKDNLDQFLATKPAYRHIKTELNQFFTLSSQVFFETHAAQESRTHHLEWLAAFCKQCRACERGLVPDTINMVGGEP